MAKVTKKINNTERAFMLLHFLWENTDDNTGVSTEEILSFFKEKKLSVNPKTIRADIKSLRSSGFDIVKFGKRPDRYKLVNRLLSADDILMLIDLVRSTKFLTQIRRRSVILKLKSLLSKNHKKTLRENVFAINPYDKTKSIDVFENLHKIQDAIVDKRKLQFKNVKYDKSLNRSKTHDSQVYIGTPVGIIFSDGFYYVGIYFDDLKMQKTFRIDRLTELSETSIPADKKLERYLYDLRFAATRGVGIHTGDKKLLTLIVHENCISSFVDKFGKISPKNLVKNVKCADDEIAIKQTVMVSSQFFGWLAAYEGMIKIAKPDSVKMDYMKYLYARYKEVKDLV